MKQNISFQYKLNQEPYYKLSSWVYNTGLEYDRHSLLYHLDFHMNDGKTIKLDAVAHPLHTTKVDGDIWSEKMVIFQVPTDAEDAVSVSIENNLGKDSTQYVCGIWVTNVPSRFYKNFPYHHLVSFFLATSENPRGSGQNVWKDLSNNKKDFLFSRPTKVSGSPLSLNTTSIVGPPCSELGLSVDNFTLGWSGRLPEVSNPKTFLKLFTSNESSSSISISFLPSQKPYNKLQVDLMGKKTSWEVGLTDVDAVYFLVNNKNNLSLFKDGVQLEDTSGKMNPLVNDESNNEESCDAEAGEVWVSRVKKRCLPSTICQDQLKESFSDSNDKTYFINKPLLVNPNKDFDATLTHLFAFKRSLSNKELREVADYFRCAPCQKIRPEITKNEPKPIHETEIKRKQKEQEDDIDEEEKSRKERCDEILQKEDEKKEIAEEERKIALFCDAQQFSDKSPLESQQAVEKLVKELNKKENEINDPCKKISYHIRNDGKIIRKKMMMPNCEQCKT